MIERIKLDRKPYILFNFYNPSITIKVASFCQYRTNEFKLLQRIVSKDEIVLIYETPTKDNFDGEHGVDGSGVNFSKLYVSNKRGIYRLEMKPVENEVTRRKYILKPGILNCSKYKLIIGNNTLCH
jgi:hypothetical protein